MKAIANVVSMILLSLVVILCCRSIWIDESIWIEGREEAFSIWFDSSAMILISDLIWQLQLSFEQQYYLFYFWLHVYFKSLLRLPFSNFILLSLFACLFACCTCSLWCLTILLQGWAYYWLRAWETTDTSGIVFAVHFYSRRLLFVLEEVGGYSKTPPP